MTKDEWLRAFRMAIADSKSISSSANRSGDDDDRRDARAQARELMSAMPDLQRIKTKIESGAPLTQAERDLAKRHVGDPP